MLNWPEFWDRLSQRILLLFIRLLDSGFGPLIILGLVIIGCFGFLVWGMTDENRISLFVTIFDWKALWLLGWVLFAVILPITSSMVRIARKHKSARITELELENTQLRKKLLEGTQEELDFVQKFDNADKEREK